MQVSPLSIFLDYNMQRERQQITRKPRKLLSRDRSSHLHKMSRQGEKQPQDKRIGSPTAIPQQKIIKGLRNQLTNLKEQVAKLTFRQQKKPLEANQIYLQYKGYYEQQNKECNNVQYVKEGKYFRRQKKKSQRARSEDSSGEQTVLLKQTGKRDAKMEEIIKQFKQFKLQNQQLMSQNQKLRNNIGRIEQKLKSSQDDQQRFDNNQLMMIENTKIRCEHLQNRSFLYQKQNDEQRLIIQQLKQTLESSTQSNLLLKQEIQLLREKSLPVQNFKSELAFKTQQLESLKNKYIELRQLLQQKQKMIDELSLELKKQKQSYAKIKQDRDRQVFINGQNKIKLVELKNKIIQLQKISQTNHNSKPKESKCKPKQQSQQIAQLQQIIRIQQKSMNNYQSDLTYLEKKLQKNQHFKHLYEKMSILLDQANQQCIRLNMCLTVNKYKPF